MTLDELRAVVLTRRMLSQEIEITESVAGVLWVKLPCPHCGLPQASYAAIYRGRVHPWECQNCYHAVAEPAPLLEEWKRTIEVSGHWPENWKDCLERHKDDGR